MRHLDQQQTRRKHHGSRYHRDLQSARSIHNLLTMTVGFLNRHAQRPQNMTSACARGSVFVHVLWSSLSTSIQHVVRHCSCCQGGRLLYITTSLRMSPRMNRHSADRRTLNRLTPDACHYAPAAPETAAPETAAPETLSHGARRNLAGEFRAASTTPSQPRRPVTPTHHERRLADHFHLPLRSPWFRHRHGYGARGAACSYGVAGRDHPPLEHPQFLA